MKRPDRALAFVRIFVGFWFVKAITSKLTWTLWAGVLPVPHVSERWIGFMPERVAEWLASNPPSWYADFLENTVLPNAASVAKLTAVGEILVGIGLTLGLLTVLSSLGGLWLIFNYALASWGTGFNQQGFHLLLIVCLLAFLLARAGRTWGLDGWLLRHRPRSFLARLHLS